MTMTTGFRPLCVVERVRESDIITSFHLEPVEADGWRDFEPGQFLVFRLPGYDGAPVLRNYSVSSDPNTRGRYRVTIKREPAPEREGGAGFGSGHFHDRLAVGDVIEAEGPRGKFTLDRASLRPVLLLSGGVGLTPMVSMLHALSATGERRVHFVHACENGAVQALGPEVREAATRRPGIHVHVRYRNANADDWCRNGHDSTGTIDRALLQSLLPLDDYDVYLCGPTPFMQAMHSTLRGLGVAKERIAYEFFGEASPLDDAAVAPITAPVVKTTALPEPAESEAGDAVTFAASGKQAAWTGGAASLLDFAEAQGLDPAFSCRAGICSSCSTRLVSGEVEYFEDPLDDPEDGHILLCCSRPKGAITLEL